MHEYLSDDRIAMLEKISNAVERLGVILSVKAEMELCEEPYNELNDLIQYYANALGVFGEEICETESCNTKPKLSTVE